MIGHPQLQRVGGLGLLVALAAVLPAHAAPTLKSSGSETFPLPEALRPQVNFWELVYARYRSDQVIVHSQRQLDVVYAVMDLGDLRVFPRPKDPARRGKQVRARRLKIEQQMQAVAAALKRLARRGTQAPGEKTEALDHAIYERLKVAGQLGALKLIARSGPSLRWQYGLSDRFVGGLARYERWAPAVRQRLEAAGVPPELIALAFVESLFDPQATSFVGAAGILQMMPATGRELGLRQTRGLDERRDPVLAAVAAAKMLAKNRKRLGNWPLALTGYNHGPNGVARAIKRLHTHDLVKIIARFRSPSWGFASKNFYTEFLAAKRVLATRSARFGAWVPAAPLEFIEQRPAGLRSLAGLWERRCSRPKDLKTQLRELNPALSEGVLMGRQRWPQGALLRLPKALPWSKIKACLSR